VQAAAWRDRADQGLQLRGGGAFDQAVHQRCSVIHGASQARTARSARGQHGGWNGLAGTAPPLSVAGAWRRLRGGWRWMGEPGGPAEAERAVDQDLVAADRDVGADLEVGQMMLPGGLLAPGDSLRVQVAVPVQLGNQGGLITLLNPDGLKVDGV
jgi:hypothetical protein